MVAILFTDLVGSTALFDRRGDEAADVLRREHFAALRGVVDDHGGREVKSTGDGLMVAFPSAETPYRMTREEFGGLTDRHFISARQENLETIHQHNVTAERFGLLGEIRSELATGEHSEHHVSMREWLDGRA